MSRSQQEQAQTERFAETYRRYQLPAMQDLESAVCGCAYGGTSWTTKAEADRIAGLLDLRPGVRLLDVGSGSGWPALYWAETTGCDAVLTDLPFDGLRIAANRARRDAIPTTCWFALADCINLPFSDGSFQAISHSDVLCCLIDKTAALRACRQILGPRGRMIFSVISISPGLAAPAYARAVEAGPPFVEMDGNYASLLPETGWRTLDCIDVTAEFAATIRRLMDEEERQRRSLGAVFDEEALAERRTSHERKVGALEDGLLRREIFNVTGA